MKRRFRYLLILIVVANISNSWALCTGKTYNPISDTNWTNMFPITSGGMRMGPNSSPPLMYINPVCSCPSHWMGIPTVGVGMTYFEPVFLAEVAKDAGCMSTLGGQEVLGDSYNTLNESSDHAGADSGGSTTRMQVHWYEYPVFSMISAFQDFGCMSSAGFAVGYMTEIDPTHQSSMWSSILSPEIILFANKYGIYSCIVDTITSTIGFPLDPIFWCAGASGFIYPLSGISQSYTTTQMGNMHVLGKFMAKMHRIGMLLMTIGPFAQCFSMYSPFWIKSQYRIDPVWPIPHYGDPIVFGMHDIMWGSLPPANFPTHEDSAYLIWVGKQCCSRF